jgi:hypothetical protein
MLFESVRTSFVAESHNQIDVPRPTIAGVSAAA